MEIDVIRFHSNAEETVGALYINGRLECWTLEDEFRLKKVMKETRIPGEIRYRLQLREYGRLHEKYKKRYPQMHKGMIEICDVPNFTDILIHQGLTEEDTAGCLLVGRSLHIDDNGRLAIVSRTSSEAYKALYLKIVSGLEFGEAWITFHDEDRIKVT